MVRTKADGGARKAVAAKAPRKSLGASGGSGSSSAILSPNAAAKNKYAGGNVVCPRATPEWQKGIKNFFIQSLNTKTQDKENDNPGDDAGAGSSKEETKNMEPIEETEENMNEENVEGEENEEGGVKEEGGENEAKEKNKTKDDEKETKETVDSEEKMDETEEEEKPQSSTTSSFKKNNCIDDSDDDDQ